MEDNFSASPMDLNVPDQQVVHVASRANRLLNMGIDLVLVSLLVYAGISVLAHVPGLAWLAPDVLLVNAQYSLKAKLVMGAFMMPYYFLFEFFFGKTPAKFLTRTRVVRAEDGEPPYLGQVLLRTVLRFMPFEVLWYAFSATGPHDFMSQTLVVEDEVAMDSSEA